MKRIRTPQEKKRLSYERDCRNVYGESGARSRFAIAKRKANVNRSFRRRTHQALELDQNTLAALDDANQRAKSIKRSAWKKTPDAPLGIVLSRELLHRGKLGGQGLDKRSQLLLASTRKIKRGR